MLGMILGSIFGAYLPVMLGADSFSFISIFGGFIGGAAGIWLSFKLINN